MKRIALLACATAAAAAFAAPATAAPEVCDIHDSLLQCVRDLLGTHGGS